MKRNATGKNGVVASAHPLATSAGLHILKKGGNAIDAALATALMLGVVAPAWSGIGGGGLGVVHLVRSDETVAVDYREVAPKKAHAEMFELDETGHVKDDSNAIGPLAIAVPGSASGVATLHERYGTMKLADICRFARDQAAGGTPIGRTLGLVLREDRDNSLTKLRRFTPTGMVFLKRGKPLRVGQKFLIPNLASTLDAIVQNGAQSFYNGNLAKEILAYLEKNGGILTEEDFAEYSTRIRKPVTATYRDYEVCGMPPPSSGGISMIEILNIIEGFDLSAMKHNSARATHTIAEAMRLAYADRAACIADPDFVSVPVSELISKKHAVDLRSSMSALGGELSTGRAESSAHGGSNTTHLSVMDREGNVVALTESIECYFGSGILIPQIGVLLNDQMHDFDPHPGELNSIEPGKRPLSSMSPTILFKEGRPCLALGSAGGPRIISSVAQTIINMVEFGMKLPEAVAAPRFHCQENTIILEKESSHSVSNDIRKFGHRIEVKRGPDLFFGGVHATHFDPAKKTFVGTADPRRDGIALAF
jgi:gamma-glutamyltranspeptidase/glutathione hydrolase